jgi:hypothetical protein
MYMYIYIYIREMEKHEGDNQVRFAVNGLSSKDLAWRRSTHHQVDQVSQITLSSLLIDSSGSISQKLMIVLGGSWHQAVINGAAGKNESTWVIKDNMPQPQKKGQKRCIQIRDSSKRVSLPAEWIFDGVDKMKKRVFIGYFSKKKLALQDMVFWIGKSQFISATGKVHISPLHRRFYSFLFQSSSDKEVVQKGDS